jgi:hypothetical protein
MLSHKIRVIVLALTAVGLATTASVQADIDARHTEYLTFSRPVALPGVTLRSGTYIFELANPDGAHDVVRVLSRDRKIVYLTAYTYPVSRPEVLPLTQFVSFHEAGADDSLPIAVWWSDNLAGREFIYPLQ